jgi:hypothetical protein
MAIKGGQILHVSGGFVIDRIQTGGVSGINVNEDRLEELGNYEAIGTLRDIPDLTFELESFDVTTELESILTGGDNTEPATTLFDLSQFVPIDIISPFKGSGQTFGIDGGVIVPFLSLESMSYNFSLSDPATMTATLRGDGVFYINQGVPYEESFDGTGAQTVFPFTNAPAFKSTISGLEYFALSVMVDQGAGAGWERQRLGVDYTNAAADFTFTTAPAAGTDNVKVVYGSATAATYNQTVHDTTKPTGVRGRDVFVRLSDGVQVTPAWTDWLGVQSANVDWSVSLERDEEFGNPQVVAQDFDTPEVSGSITMKPVDVDALFAQIVLASGLSGTDIANATQDPPELDVEIKVVDDAGDTQKTLIVPDAKFVMPQIQGQVGNKLEQDFSFTSSSGTLEVYKNDP